MAFSVKMHVFLSIAIVSFFCALSNAVEGNEIVDNSLEYNEYSDDDYGALGRTDLDYEDNSGVENKDDLRQIIFNPRKRRERRKKHRGNKHQNILNIIYFIS